MPSWAVELRIPGKGEWVIVAADMTEEQAITYINNHRVNGGHYRTRELEGPAYGK